MKLSFTYISITLGLIALIITICVTFPSIEHPFEIVEVENSKCLDGTNYKFLFSQGTNTKKFMIYFEGGGLCSQEGDEFLESCLDRSKKYLGSSKSFLFFSTTIFSKYSRFFSKKAKYNPLFHDWNKVFVKYCDGMMHTGILNEPRKAKDGTPLYFNGETNVLGVLEFLKTKHDFNNADKVLVTGFSAGGVASGIWGNYINKMVTPAQGEGALPKVVVLDDAGFSVEFETKNKRQIFREYIDKLVAVTWNEESYAASKLRRTYCNEDLKDYWKCYFPEYYFPNLKVPILLTQSQYDCWFIGQLTENKCFYKGLTMLNECNQDEKNEMKKYATKSNEALIKLQQTLPKEAPLSLWLPKSFTHTFTMFGDSWDNPAWAVEGKTLNDVVDAWMKDPFKTFTIIEQSEDKIAKTFLKDLIWYEHYLDIA